MSSISGGPVGNCYIIPLDTRKNQNGEYYLPIYYYFTLGEGNSITENSALVKPFKKIMDGSPINSVAFVFYKEKNQHYVFGSFSNHRKIIFFPGLTFSRVIRSPDGRDIPHSEIHNIDHFTLEENLRKWHVTLKQRNEGVKYSRQRTRKVNNEAYLWFVMALRDVTKFEPMPRTQEYILKGTQSDLIRRQKLMLESRENIEFPIMETNYEPSPPFFLNIEVYVSNKKIDDNLPPEIITMPAPISILEQQEQLRSRSLDLVLKNSTYLSIRISKIRGDIIYDAVYFAGGRYNYPN